MKEVKLLDLETNKCLQTYSLQHYVDGASRQWVIVHQRLRMRYYELLVNIKRGS